MTVKPIKTAVARAAQTGPVAAQPPVAPFTLKELQFIAESLDAFNRANGLRVAVACLTVMQKVEALAQAQGGEENAGKGPSDTPQAPSGTPQA